MVLRVDVMDAALRGFYGVDPMELRHQRRVVALTATGRVLDDRLVDELAAEPDVTLLCGRYEGFDERIVEHFATDAVSIGEYVLAGGELAAMVVCDAILRKLPGALGDSASALEESFSVALEGRPEYPHYTRPAEHRGWRVPEVLLSGHHEQIRRWREAQSRERAAHRPPRDAVVGDVAAATGADVAGPEGGPAVGEAGDVARRGGGSAAAGEAGDVARRGGGSAAGEAGDTSQRGDGPAAEEARDPGGSPA
jgi:tRNA (guanine37-N1)-methyltransferase